MRWGKAFPIWPYGCGVGQLLWKTARQVLRRLNLCLPHDPAVPLLGCVRQTAARRSGHLCPYNKWHMHVRSSLTQSGWKVETDVCQLTCGCAKYVNKVFHTVEYFGQQKGRKYWYMQHPGLTRTHHARGDSQSPRATYCQVHSCAVFGMGRSVETSCVSGCLRARGDGE